MYTLSIATLKSLYYRPGFLEYVKALLKDCLNCHTNKHRPKDTAELLHPKRDVTEPLDTIHIDYKGPFNPPSHGYQYVLVIVESFSTFAYAEPTKRATAAAAVNALEKFSLKYGFPRKIISDAGSHFKAKEFQQYCHAHTLLSKILSGYNPWSKS